MNDLYKAMNPQKSNSMMDQFGQFMKNPMQFLMNRKINIPEEYANDPHGAVQYLLNNGQMSQDTLNRMTQFVNKAGIKLQ